MCSILKVDLENCVHRALLRMPAVKSNEAEDKDYLISLFSQSTSDTIVNISLQGKNKTLICKEMHRKRIKSIQTEYVWNSKMKLTIVNVKCVSEHYTSEITRNEYDVMKRAQALLIGFDDFLNQLKTLLTHCEEDKLKIKLQLQNIVELIFFTTSDVKELVMLSVPFVHTTKEDLIKFLQKRNDVLELQCKTYLGRTKALQERLLAQNQQYQHVCDTVDRTYEEKEDLESRYSKLEQECRRLRQILNEIDAKNKNLEKDLKQTQKTNSELNFTVNELRSDIESLKIGIDYYVTKNNHLVTVLAEQKRTTIPIEKYDKLNNMFCSAIADLLKSQMNLKQLLSQRDSQKSENSALKEELTNCIAMINNLEEKLQENEGPSDDESAKILSEMIKKLEIQAALNPSENEDN